MFTFVKSMEVVVMVVLGGMGSITGSIVAATLLTVALESLQAADQYRMVIYSMLLIVLMLTRPQRALRHARDLGRGRRAGCGGAPTEGRRERGRDAPVLEARGVVMRFGGLTALSDFDLSLRTGELVGLIGPNGAGKTTAFNALTGVYAPTEGEVQVGRTRRERPAPAPDLRAGRRPHLPERAPLQGAHRLRQRAHRLPRRVAERVHLGLAAHAPPRRRGGADPPAAPRSSSR